MAQAYTNSQGAGARQNKIEITTNAANANSRSPNLLIDGSMSDSGGYYWNAGQTGRYIQFDFMELRVVDEAKWYQSSAGSHGTWKWQGSNNGVDFTDIGGTFDLGGGTATTTHISLNGNTTAYQIYRLQQTAGTTNVNPYLREIEFRIDQPTSGDSWLTSLGWGNRSSLITGSQAAGLFAGGTAAKLVDGTNSTDAWFEAGQSGKWILFDFGAGNAPVLTDAKWLQDTTHAHGTWKWQGSNDNSVFEDIGSTFTFAGALASHLPMTGNTLAYRYYKLVQTAGVTVTNGTTNTGPYLYEIWFKQNLLVSESETGDGTVTASGEADCNFEYAQSSSGDYGSSGEASVAFGYNFSFDAAALSLEGGAIRSVNAEGEIAWESAGEAAVAGQAVVRVVEIQIITNVLIYAGGFVVLEGAAEVSGTRNHAFAGGGTPEFIGWAEAMISAATGSAAPTSGQLFPTGY